MEFAKSDFKKTPSLEPVESFQSRRNDLNFFETALEGVTVMTLVWERPKDLHQMMKRKMTHEIS